MKERASVLTGSHIGTHLVTVIPDGFTHVVSVLFLLSRHTDVPHPPLLNVQLLDLNAISSQNLSAVFT